MSAPQPVYNLTVADAHEYYANGVLVHNCDPARYLCATLDGNTFAFGRGDAGSIQRTPTTPGSAAGRFLADLGRLNIVDPA